MLLGIVRTLGSNPSVPANNSLETLNSKKYTPLWGVSCGIQWYPITEKSGGSVPSSNATSSIGLGVSYTVSSPGVFVLQTINIGAGVKINFIVLEYWDW